jgi:tRNA1(Val) A37 N6-methylase TrmN6
MGEFTEGGLLGGRVAYRQLARGHRTGFEPVLLAASCPARAGELVLEAGTGAGAALLCLAARVPGVGGIGVELDPALAQLANENFRNNGLTGVFCVSADAGRLPFPANAFDHAIANPPWFNSAGTLSPDQQRSRAHHAGPGLLTAWVDGLARCLRPRGSLTLIMPAASLSAAAAALRKACGGITLLPLWPRAGSPAKMIIVTARKGTNSPDAVLPGLVLHDEGGITPEAQAVLRDGTGFFSAR